MDIGLPPYSDEDRWQVQRMIAIVRAEIARPVPDANELRKAESKLRKVSVKVLTWLAKKLDLAVDELIKKGITAAVAGGAFWVMYQVADDIAQVVEKVVPTF